MTHLGARMCPANMRDVSRLRGWSGSCKVQRVLDALLKFEREDGLDQLIDVGEATTGKLAKLVAFSAKGISAQSQSLGTGRASLVMA